MDKKILDQVLVFSGIAILVFLAFLTLRSIWVPIFLAFILGYIFRPAYESVYKKTRLKKLSALIIIFGLLIFILVPISFLIPSVITQTFGLYNMIQGLNIGDFLNSILPANMSSEFIRTINLQMENILANLFNFLTAGFTSFLSNLPLRILNVIIFIFVFYFVLVDFDKIGKAFADFLPLSKNSKQKFASEFRNVTEGILYGQILVGILQGVLIGLMLYLLGVEGTLLFTIIAIIAGILPLVGPAVIWVPVGTFLLIAGNPIKAIILIVYCNIISWMTEGFVRPYILSRRTSIPMAWGFLSTLGGLFAFGIIGLVLGPLIISYLIIIFQFYKQGKLQELFNPE